MKKISNKPEENVVESLAMQEMIKIIYGRTERKIEWISQVSSKRRLPVPSRSPRFTSDIIKKAEGKILNKTSSHSSWSVSTSVILKLLHICFLIFYSPWLGGQTGLTAVGAATSDEKRVYPLGAILLQWKMT